MRILTDQTEYILYDGDMKIENKLPLGVYKLDFHPKKGFSLIKNSIPTDIKLYGKKTEKVEKILKSFKSSTKSMGVLFSGEKGTGKTALMRRLILEAVKDYPVIIIDYYYPGFTDFLSRFDVPCVLFFDEYDKTFRDRKDGDIKTEDEMLTFFDGLSNNNSFLFCLCCNKTRNVSEYLINRPGRIRYHIKFGFLTPDEVFEFSEAELDAPYKKLAKSLASLSKTFDFTYDILSAIVRELNLGYSIDETLEDLNIEDKSDMHYNATLVDVKGNIIDVIKNVNIPRMGYCNIYFKPNKSERSNCLDCNFLVENIQFEGTKIFVPKDYLEVSDYDYDDGRYDDVIDSISHIELTIQEKGKQFNGISMLNYLV